MAIYTFKNEILPQFDEYRKKYTKRKLSNVQLIVEFYRYISGLREFEERNNWQFPFSRYVRAAKKLNEWANGDLEKVYGLIWDMKLHFRSIGDNGLTWCLDTVYRHIPAYEDSKIEHMHEEETASDFERYEIEKSEKISEERKTLEERRKKAYNL